MAPSNNEMQRTSRGSDAGSPLISVFAGLQERGVYRHATVISYAVLALSCAAARMPAATPAITERADDSPKYQRGPAALRFRTGRYMIVAGCEARCKAIGDEWHGEVTCPGASIGLTAPMTPPVYDEAVHVTLPSGIEMISGATTSHGLRIFCASAVPPPGSETACTEVATEAARARLGACAKLQHARGHPGGGVQSSERYVSRLGTPANKALKLTSLTAPVGFGLQLNAVFGGPERR
jgi:hypothetical protein